MAFVRFLEGFQERWEDYGDGVAQFGHDAIVANAARWQRGPTFQFRQSPAVAPVVR